MYAYIEGRLVLKEAAHVVLDVQGIGYDIKISLNTFAAIKNVEKCKLFTYLHVKEDAHTLYGFFNQEEKDLFLHLISISGVGPGTALVVLSSLPADELRAAITSENVKAIQSVKGIGAKTAQRIILELKDKILKSEHISRPDNFTSQAYNTIHEEALSALTTLGINKAVAEKTVNSILKKFGSDISLEDVIKQALKSS
ncbi:MAG: Holliday junction branch migration protein RuvA [Cyclobacteriaceae bacterium]